MAGIDAHIHGVTVRAYIDIPAKFEKDVATIAEIQIPPSHPESGLDIRTHG
ncbi:MAG: hypothetical protein HKL95_02410 [Phycisphaerae bacterium]|nr:hypothetical protein [Phycisphaerae bacterium]